MAKLNCFALLVGKKKKDKGNKESLGNDEHKGQKTLQVKIEHPVNSSKSEELALTTFTVEVPYSIPNNSQCSVKVMSHKSPVGDEVVEVAYEGEDEHEENSPMKKNYSDFDLSAHEDLSGDKDSGLSNANADFSYPSDTLVKEQFDDKDSEKGVDMIQTGHISDPGVGKAEFWSSPKLKRSCSNVETRYVLRKIADLHLPPSKSQSFEQLQELSEKVRQNIDPGSPKSVMTHCSADRVMLKKRSSSQVLPSRSRRLWWKLFLWSHRNLHNASWAMKSHSPPTRAVLNPQGGYSSDTLEPNQTMELGKMASPGSFTGESLNKGDNNNNNNGNKSWNAFQNGASGLWPQNQWVAFSSDSSPFARVDEWVKGLETQYPLPVIDNYENDEGITFPPSPETGKSPARSPTHLTRQHDINFTEEILHANSVIESLNSSSTVAHISGIGLKAIPIISSFLSLRSVNLSNNFIVQITPGSLPKGLHTLNLSRNKITTIEGLRELTRLRVLDISYNRISRIGHGLSNCTLIKELYVAGNKISDVEGLHRLLKLTVLDLSFNKITTTKALGQLVANYHTLQALNLLGNPIQSNISDDQLRKAVCDLLPKLAYLNKQPIKPQRARELLTDSVAKAALGNRSSRKKAGKRTSQRHCCSIVRMVLSNKKLKRKLRAELAETITKTVSESDPNNGGPTKPDPNAKPQLSLKELIDSATQKPRLTKREKRRKKLSLEDPEAVKSRRSGGGGDPEEKEGGSESLVEKKKKKKRKREEEVKDGALDSEENGVVKEAKKSKKKKKKKKKKVKKKEEEGKSEEENNGTELGSEGKGVMETNKNGESQPYEEVAKKIYVGGIPYYSTEDDIRSFFESCGTITEIDCMKFPESGKFRGIAIISFKTEAAAKRALALDGADMGGLYLKIQPYKATRVIKLPDFAPKIVEGYNRIYVGNLSWDITEDELRNFFSDCNISSIRFGEDKETGEFRGYAHVDFSDSLSLTMALKLDQQIVCGRPVKISCAVPMKGAGIKSRSAHTSEVVDNATSQGADNTTNQIADNAANQVADKAEQSSVSGKIRRRTCYECGEKGHLSSACPKKQNADPTNSGAS